MSENEDFAEDSTKQRDRSAIRRKFLKGAAAVSGVMAPYTVPKFSSVHAKPAYAAITGRMRIVPRNSWESQRKILHQYS